MILRESIHDFPIFAYYNELIRVVSRFPRYISFLTVHFNRDRLSFYTEIQIIVGAVQVERCRIRTCNAMQTKGPPHKKMYHHILDKFKGARCLKGKWWEKNTDFI